jgi:hypothetical protein
MPLKHGAASEVQQSRVCSSGWSERSAVPGDGGRMRSLSRVFAPALVGGVPPTQRSCRKNVDHVSTHDPRRARRSERALWRLQQWLCCDHVRRHVEPPRLDARTSWLAASKRAQDRAPRGCFGRIGRRGLGNVRCLMSDVQFLSVRETVRRPRRSSSPVSQPLTKCSPRAINVATGRRTLGRHPNVQFKC